MHIMDAMFRYTHFGLVSGWHGDIFIGQGKNNEAAVQRAIESGAKRFVARGRKWCILFPEGGLLHKLREKSQRYAEAHGLPILRHVAIPRMGAYGQVVDRLYGSTSYLLDITIGYPQRSPLSMLRLFAGTLNPQPYRLGVHLRRFRMDEIPSDREARERWLVDRWVEKEALLAAWYTNGTFRVATSAAAAFVDEASMAYHHGGPDPYAQAPLHISPLDALLPQIMIMMMNVLAVWLLLGL